jgi:hypothetical protein
MKWFTREHETLYVCLDCLAETWVVTTKICKECLGFNLQTAGEINNATEKGILEENHL